MRCVCPIVLSLLFCGCVAPDFGGDTEHENLTYADYVSGVGVNSIDPIGASHIYYRCHSTRDGYDCWWRLTINSSDFNNLLAQMSDDMENSEYASYDSQRVGPVRKTTTDDPALPSNWPRPDDTPPDWWQQHEDGQRMSCTRWELQVDDTAFDGRSKGWHWRYDADSTTLWVWHWNHQHFDLGWETDTSDTGRRPSSQTPHNKTVHTKPWALRIFDSTFSLHGPVTVVVMQQARH